MGARRDSRTSVGLWAKPALRFFHLLLLASLIGCNSPREIERISSKPISYSKVRVGGIVLKWVMGEKQLNYERAEPLIRQAAAQGAEIVVTTECFLDGYAIRDKKLSEQDWNALTETVPDGEYVQRLSRLAAELKVYLITGLVERIDRGTYNTALLFAPDGSLIGKYHKHDLEHELWRNTPGTEYPVFQTPFGKVGLIICADRRNVELVKKIAGQSDLVICPSGGMWGPQKNDFYLQDRSRENQVAIVFVHPTEFLVTGADGAILDRRFAGDAMTLKKPELGGEKDVTLVAFFDVPLRRSQE